MCIILLAVIVIATDFTPQGDINLRGLYAIKNATDIAAGNGTVHMNSTGFFGWLNWSWLTNLPSYVKDWDYKLNASDQRYNDTSYVASNYVPYLGANRTIYLNNQTIDKLADSSKMALISIYYL